MLGQASAAFQVRQTELLPDTVAQRYTRGTGLKSINSKLLVAKTNVPVPSNTTLDFSASADPITYRALLYELREPDGVTPSHIVPNWFGVAIPHPDFDLSSDVHVVLYFHPEPAQAGYRDADYYAKTGTAGGADWKQLFAYVDRLGGQMAGAIQYGTPANRLVIFPFLTQTPYTLPTSEWANIIHDILQDINANWVNRICTRPKKIIVAGLSNGSRDLNRFLDETSILPNIVEVWDFDSDITTPQVLVDPHGKRLRAYWQNPRAPSTPADADFVRVPASSWTNFPNPPPNEVPPLPPNASNSVSNPDTTVVLRVHHDIRDTMFLDAVWKLANPSA